MAAVLEIPDEFDARVDALAAKTGQPKANLLRDLLHGVLEDIEDIYESERVLERIRSGEERVYTAEELRRELGLDD